MPSAKAIEQGFQDAWNEFGDDKSTEFLIGITADRMNIEYMDVVETLCATHGKNKVRPVKGAESR